MKTRKLTGLSVIALLIIASFLAGYARHSPLAQPAPGRALAAPLEAGEAGDRPAQEQPTATDPLILSYAAKFVCTEALQPGMAYYGVAAPIVQQKTEVLLHNPNAFPVTFYKKAVRATNISGAPAAPGAWTSKVLEPDYAVRIDCDEIARMLTGIPAATFIGTYGIGVTVEGYVVIGIGPQMVAGTNLLRYANLDVTAEYARSSEVLKKDVHYQPWWRWWWWGLPWRLGYPYERLLFIGDNTRNIDCRGLLYDALMQDAAREITDPITLNHTLSALQVGQQIDGGTALPNEDTPAALVALIGNCSKLNDTQLNVAYTLVSNKASTDPDPRGGGNAPSQVLYPWLPGRWYDLPVVMPQNVSTDLNDYFLRWHSQRWIDAGESQAVVNAAMVYYFPYWCGWGYWWPWWNAGDCVDIGVGEGESLDVETIAPMRVFMPSWPPN
ncbi:MAG: hypothetical protein L0Z70_15045 [Chloroflexi bacterium]|nr:hypothetical protein [Chloroflexota bacterium]